MTTIFDMLYPKYKITKPIRMITLFSGYDSQCLAMKYLGVNYEYHELSAVHMEDAEYNLSLSLEFLRYLLGVATRL